MQGQGVHMHYESLVLAPQKSSLIKITLQLVSTIIMLCYLGQSMCVKYGDAVHMFLQHDFCTWPRKVTSLISLPCNNNYSSLL